MFLHAHMESGDARIHEKRDRSEKHECASEPRLAPNQERQKAEPDNDAIWIALVDTQRAGRQATEILRSQSDAEADDADGNQEQAGAD
jgi:hypothetical protein